MSGNDNIISAYTRSEKRVWKMSILGSDIGSGFGEPGGTPLPRIPRNTPPGYDIKLPLLRPGLTHLRKGPAVGEGGGGVEVGG